MSYTRILPVKGTYAELDLAGPATQLDTVIQAVAEGPDGNLVTIAAVADNDALTKAELDLATVAGDLDTVIEAVTAGAAGNDITITVVGDSAAAAGVTLTEVGNLVTIHFETAVSTVADVEAAIAADATLIAVKTAGTGATVLDSATDECTAESLAGGLDSEGVTFDVTGTAIVCHFADGESTVEDFEAALEADAAVSALVGIKTAGTAANVLAVTDDDFAATALVGAGATSASAPSATDSEAGVALPHLTDTIIVLVKSEAGSGTMTATATIYGWQPELGRWFKLKALNAGAAIAETGTDAIHYYEAISSVYSFSRVDCALSVAGTGTEVQVGVIAIPSAFSKA